MPSDPGLRLRPPTPDMQGRELVQWLQRVYDVLIAYQTDPGPVIPPIPSSHDDLTENGGPGSHGLIATHISAQTAHGRGSALVGVSDAQTLINKTLDALQNTISGLRHGTEVDSPSSGVHGVTGSVVGTTDVQQLTNKDIRRTVALHTGGAYAAALTEDTIICYAASAITLPTTTAAAIGKVLTITNASATANVTVTGSAIGFTVNGPATQTLPPRSSVTLVFDSNSWRII